MDANHFGVSSRIGVVYASINELLAVENNIPSTQAPQVEGRLGRIL
jgi:hypothetical protein